jgi:hypothetical protein
MRLFNRFLFCFTVLVILIFAGSNIAYAQWTHARQWNVYPGSDPEATRTFIQAVIDEARDGDTIYFNRGTYDFSMAPTQYSFQNGGALQIIDKSLTVKGAPGSIIVGAPVIIDDTGMKGITCFWILNSNARKDVTIDGLTLRTFMIGIDTVYSNEDPDNPIYYSNLKNLVVNNCTFQDMKRNGIGTAGAQGNITITNNRINGDRASSRFGIYSDWLFEPGMLEWQPANTLISITNNSIAGFNYAGILSNRPSKMLITGNAVSNSGSGIIFNDGLKIGAMVANNTLSDLDNGVIVFGSTYPINEVMFQGLAQGLKLTFNDMSNIQSCGIFIWGDLVYSNFIISNKINMINNTGWGPAIYSEGHNEQYVNNTIRGYGYQAVALVGEDFSADGGLIWGAHHEYFLHNSISGFAPQDPYNPPNIGWDYELDGYTHDNVVIGIRTENATYVDYGVNNIFKFVDPYVSPTITTFLMSPPPSKTQNKPQKGTAIK